MIIHQNMINKTLSRLLLSTIIAIGLSACQTPNSVKNWPSDIPDRSIFVDAYKKQKSEGNNDNNIETHLLWIKRFYRGSIIYPIGWNDMTNMVVDSIDDSQSELKQSAQKRLDILGEKIAIEWAQSNNSRNINSSNIATWGSALRTSVKRKQQFDFLDKVEKDVDDLIERTLSMKAIKRERYYPPEDFDDF